MLAFPYPEVFAFSALSFWKTGVLTMGTGRARLSARPL